jgi:hypothetical protein
MSKNLFEITDEVYALIKSELKPYSIQCERCGDELDFDAEFDSCGDLIIKVNTEHNCLAEDCYEV